MREFSIPNETGRIIIVSDCHLDYFDGVAGYSSRERNKLMCDALMRADADAVIYAGDMTFRNSKSGLPLDSIYEWKSIAYDPLCDKTQVFALNASHDSMTADEFYTVFGYEHNYAVFHGDVAYICLDTFAGERDNTHQTMPSDIDAETLKDALEIAHREGIKAAFVVCHFPSDGENLLKLMNDERIIAVFAGHTHDNFITTVSAAIASIRTPLYECKKTLVQTGHFSRAHTKRIHDGCGFKQFVPMMNGDGRCTSDLDESVTVEDYSRTGSPWQYRAVERKEDGIQSYMIFPEADYGEFVGDKITFPAFHQPYAEGFGDRSYIEFALK